MKIEMSLLDVLALRSQCNYLSDLQRLSDGQRFELIREVRRIKPEEASLKEWNDALEYIFAEPARLTQEAARERLIELLKREAKPAK